MNTYNFFYRGYVDGVAVDKPFNSVESVASADTTEEYKILAQIQSRGNVMAFGWTETIPYEVN